MEIKAQSFWVQKDGASKEEYEDAVWPQEYREYKKCCLRLSYSLIQKDDSSKEEYEDAIWPQEYEEYKENCVRFAIADGATESSYSKLWSEMLVKAVGEGRLTCNDFQKDLKSIRLEWQEAITKKNLPWYAEQKVYQGAFSAVVALEIREGEANNPLEGNWESRAIGDSCLFQMREEELIFSFPIEESQTFDNSPFLLGSINKGERLTEQNLLSKNGRWKSGDTFYLMTDALACWFLKAIENGHKPWKNLPKANFPKDSSEQQNFVKQILSLRSKKWIRNDDSTLLSIQIF
jgi:hypothetical protein